MKIAILLSILCALSCRYKDLENSIIQDCVIWCEDEERGGLDRIEFTFDGPLCHCECGEFDYLYSIKKKRELDAD